MTPGSSQAFWLFHLPLMLGVVFLVWLVLSWRGFMALLGACGAFILYLLIAVAELQSIIGVVMLRASFWVAVVFLAIAAFVSGLPPLFSSAARKP